MTTLNINDLKYFDPFLQTLEDNTFKNYHTENCMLITSNAKTDGLFMNLEDLNNRWFVMDHILNYLHEDQKVKIRKYIKQLIKEEKGGK